MKRDATANWSSLGGAMGEAIRAKDWSVTPLGSMDRWSQSLKAIVSMMITNGFPMIVLWGPNLVQIYNDSYREIMGVRHPAGLGQPTLECWPEVAHINMPIYDRVFAGETATFDNSLYPIIRNGQLEDCWFTLSYSPLCDDDGAISGVMVALVETTARVRAELKLRTSDDRQRQTLRQMPGFIAVVSGPSHIYQYVNDAYLTIAGNRDFLGRSVRDVFPELVDQGFYELLDHVYATGKRFVAKAFSIRFMGEETDRYIDFVYEPMRDEAGTVIGIFVGGYDISERVRAEQLLRRSEESLRELNGSLESRIAAAIAEREKVEEQLRQAQKMEAVGQLTGGLAHDFNNLLAGISGSLELIAMRMKQGRFTDIERYITAAQGATRRAAALTHRLLAFSRRQTLDPKPTDVNHLIMGMKEMIQRTIGPTIALEIVAPSDLWLALVDQSQLENALLILCINARDAMPDGGRITVYTANVRLDANAAKTVDIPPGQYLSLQVSDTGSGMPPELVERVFEPFFTTKPIGEGTGLGLSMIYGFAKQSAGQVYIQSEVGKGTTVFIYLPRYSGDLDAEVFCASKGTSYAEQGETVLIVDDEPTVRMLVTDILEELGYKAIEAADSMAGLKILQSIARIDLLITDVGLPGGMNGRQMADAARVSRPNLKVLFITGYAESSIVGSGNLEPGMAVMTKPFPIENMTVRIREIINA